MSMATEKVTRFRPGTFVLPTPRRARGSSMSVAVAAPKRMCAAVSADPKYVRKLRRTGVACLVGWGLVERVDVSVVALLISEMATNAIVHTCGKTVSLSLSYAEGDGEIRIEVRDGTPGRRPRLLAPDDDQEHGRGVLIVAALARSWGTGEEGACTWCTVPVADPPSVPACARRALPPAESGPGSGRGTGSGTATGTTNSTYRKDSMREHDVITVACWDFENDSAPDGKNWHLAHELLADHQPDIFLRQGMTHGRTMGGRRLRVSEDLLGMRGALSAPNRNAVAYRDIATAVFVRPEVFRILAVYPVAKPWWLHPAHVVLRFGECPTPLNVVSFSLCGFDPHTRESEARWLTTLAEPGAVTLAGGNTNSYPYRPEPVELPDWAQVTDLAHECGRTVRTRDGWIADTRPDEVLAMAGYRDLARDLCARIGRSKALAPTAGFRGLGRGGPERVDRVYGVGLSEVVTSVEVVNTHQTREVSDHALVLVRLHRARLAARLGAEQAQAA
ncbi:ATP-binding protein [Streptomyces sp. B1866]|uniref:ATP-binding protein n=1 Tax=Streptomyces sp. B1866 TaxID=3075431 RepID=UPI00288E2437|nr:ATP-binding protein [Streptomyces sp. B1866]MDT3397007.1 ATP-binding protein [Streptomyces sp. B1866]